jgi:hypothetical protein
VFRDDIVDLGKLRFAHTDQRDIDVGGRKHMVEQQPAPSGCRL